MDDLLTDVFRALHYPGAALGEGVGRLQELLIFLLAGALFGFRLRFGLLTAVLLPSGFILLMAAFPFGFGILAALFFYLGIFCFGVYFGSAIGEWSRQRL